MISLALYFLAAFGAAYIVGHSVISAPIRSFVGGPIDKPRAYFGLVVALVECPACLGTWIGLAVGGLHPDLFLQSSSVTGALVAACATAGVNFIAGSMTGLMPGEEDPMKAQVASLLQAQMGFMAREQSPILRPYDFGPPYGPGLGTMDQSLKMRANAAGVLTPDEGLVERARAKYATGLEMLTPDEQMALDFENNSGRAEGIVSDAEIERAAERERNAPDDTPENWAKYREAQDFAERLADEILKARGAKDYWAVFNGPNTLENRLAREKHERIHQRDEESLRHARMEAGALRPKDPMNTHSLADAPGFDDVTPEDIAAFERARTEAQVVATVVVAEDAKALNKTDFDEEF